jgi:AcrR family transcriptional regulator
MRGEQKSSSRGIRLTNTPNRRSHEERRVEIADAALRLIATEGIASLTVAALAKELGLTGGALYRHFPSSDAILDAVAERAVELLDASLPDPSLSPMVWLEQFVDSRTRAVSGHKGLASLIISDQLAKALPRRHLSTYGARYVELLCRWSEPFCPANPKARSAKICRRASWLRWSWELSR